VAGLGRAVRRPPHPRLLADDPGRPAPGDDQSGTGPGSGASAAEPCLYSQTSVPGRPELRERCWRNASGTSRTRRRPEARHAWCFRGRHGPCRASARTDAEFWFTRWSWPRLWFGISAAQTAPGRRTRVHTRGLATRSRARLRGAGTGFASAAAPGSAQARATKRTQAHARACPRGDRRIRNARQRPAPALDLWERPGQSGGRRFQTRACTGRVHWRGVCAHEPAAQVGSNARSGCADRTASLCRWAASVAGLGGCGQRACRRFDLRDVTPGGAGLWRR